MDPWTHAILVAAITCMVSIGEVRTALQCPVTVTSCSCRTSYTYYRDIYCERLGTVNSLPAFEDSNKAIILQSIKIDDIIDSGFCS